MSAGFHSLIDGEMSFPEQLTPMRMFVPRAFQSVCA